MKKNALEDTITDFTRELHATKTDPNAKAGEIEILENKLRELEQEYREMWAKNRNIR